MAGPTAKSLKNLKPIKKGEVRNPRGAGAHNPALRALKSLTLETYREVIELVLTGNLRGIENMIRNPETPAIQVGVATAFMKAIKNGDYAVIERIAERIVGKIPDEVRIKSDNTNNTSLVIDRVALREAYKKLDDEV